MNVARQLCLLLKKNFFEHLCVAYWKTWFKKKEQRGHQTEFTIICHGSCLMVHYTLRRWKSWSGLLCAAWFLFLSTYTFYLGHNKIISYANSEERLPLSLI